MSKTDTAKNKEELNISLEDVFAKLDLLISELEKPEQSLEASFKAFEEGMQKPM